MPEGATEVINKKEIGARIKRMRKDTGLRQWQLAEMIGATQPAIHMYERGVLPEPKRLLELARIGNTSVEWILTGRHWENGSEEMHRVPQDVYHLAFQLREFGELDRDALESALQIINEAAAAIRRDGSEDLSGITVEEIARRLRALSGGILQALTKAMRVHESIQRSLLAQGIDRMQRSGLDPAVAAEDGVELSDAGGPAARRKRSSRARSTSIEPVRGHIFRVDGSLLVVRDILKDKELRSEFEDTLTRLSSKLESKRARILKMRKADRAK